MAAYYVDRPRPFHLPWAMKKSWDDQTQPYVTLQESVRGTMGAGCLDCFPFNHIVFIQLLHIRMTGFNSNSENLQRSIGKWFSVPAWDSIHSIIGRREERLLLHRNNISTWGWRNKEEEIKSIANIIPVQVTTPNESLSLSWWSFTVIIQHQKPKLRLACDAPL